ncbi:hypothetical protein PPERSA_07305 [Pseudocohnilembus persalinus]|uniref:Sde2 N-terminal ubiquitin domain-containing protein n=1 Tax=Pseudocohnilembus persalinus TaxID=266149 RepID=A0A0V0R6V9_PSEPJ|nr:hypothetical protein PPERSA_07305 [Pseudocohnilembus persalinus]|eukprot:KRX10220.1 hypothetical protein PPERSA_07305 [Pseudocohnilembus persalinus]
MVDIIANFPFISKQICLEKEKLMSQNFINENNNLTEHFIIYALSQALKQQNFQQLLNNIYILSSGKYVENIDKNFLEKANNLTFNIKLKGGKGAFGAEMKKQAKQKDKITNWDNSRDLHGRRIINQTMEEKLIAFYKKKKEEDKMINEALEKYKIEQATIKQGTQQVRIQQEYKDKIEKIENGMASTVLSGIKKLRNKQEDKQEEKNKQAVKKQQEIIDESVQNQQEENKENLSSSPEETKENQKNQDEVPSQQCKQLLEEDQIIKKQKTEQDQKLNEDKLQEQDLKPKFEEINLEKINSLEQIINDFEDEHLKAELQRLGIKSGGLKKDRAKRLWDIKLDPSKLFHPKYLAKKQ